LSIAIGQAAERARRQRVRKGGSGRAGMSPASPARGSGGAYAATLTARPPVFTNMEKAIAPRLRCRVWRARAAGSYVAVWPV